MCCVVMDWEELCCLCVSQASLMLLVLECLFNVLQEAINSKQEAQQPKKSQKSNNTKSYTKSLELSYMIGRRRSTIVVIYFLFLLAHCIQAIRLRSILDKRWLLHSKNMGAKPSKEYDDNLYTKPVAGVSFTEQIIDIRGERRNVVKWLPTGQTPKGLVLISHGLYEHSLRYAGLAHALTAKGYAVMAIDHMAHGFSGGTKGLITDFHILENDFVTFSQIARAEYPAVPCYLFSHSMGTLVASLALKQIQTNMKAVVFSGCPLFAGYAAASPFGIRALYPLTQTSFALTLTWALSNVDPKGAAAPILLEELTSDEGEKQVILKDRRRVECDIMNKTAYEVLRMIDEVKSTLPTIKVPFHAIHGAVDMVALSMGSEYLMTHTGTAAHEKSLKVYPRLKHELFHEDAVSREQAIADVVMYLEQQHSR